MDNLTQGSVSKTLIVYSIPLVVANLFIAIINIVDISIVGHYFGLIYSTGIGIASQLNYLITSFAIGFASGISIIVGKQCGEKSSNGVKNTVVAGGILALAIAAALMAVQYFFTDEILVLFNTPAESLEIAKNYSKTFVLAIPFTFIFNMILAVARGTGDSIKPMYAIILYAALNIGGTFFAIEVLKTGYLGAQYANIAALAILSILCTIYIIILVRRNYNGGKLSLDCKQFWHIIKISAPIALLNAEASISFILLTRLANIIAPNQVQKNIHVLAIKYNGFAVLPVRGLEGGVAAAVAQSIGANKKDRVRKTLVCGLIAALCIGVVLMAVSAIIPEKILLLLGASAEVAAEGSKYFRIMSIDCFVVPFSVIMYGIVEGCGKTSVTMLISTVASLLVRVGLAYLLKNMGIIGIAIAIPSASLFAALCIWFYAIKKRKDCALTLKD